MDCNTGVANKSQTVSGQNYTGIRPVRGSGPGAGATVSAAAPPVARASRCVIGCRVEGIVVPSGGYWPLVAVAAALWAVDRADWTLAEPLSADCTAAHSSWEIFG